MADLIACISHNKAGWGHVQRLIKEEEWEHVYLICDKEIEGFCSEKKVTYIKADPNMPIDQYITHVKKQLEKKIRFGEVGLNLVCGTGKEHMGILAAVMGMGVGLRLVAVTKDGVKEL